MRRWREPRISACNTCNGRLQTAPARRVASNIKSHLGRSAVVSAARQVQNGDWMNSGALGVFTEEVIMRLLNAALVVLLTVTGAFVSQSAVAGGRGGVGVAGGGGVGGGAGGGVGAGVGVQAGAGVRAGAGDRDGLPRRR